MKKRLFLIGTIALMTIAAVGCRTRKVQVIQDESGMVQDVIVEEATGLPEKDEDLPLISISGYEPEEGFFNTIRTAHTDEFNAQDEQWVKTNGNPFTWTEGVYCVDADTEAILLTQDEWTNGVTEPVFEYQMGPCVFNKDMTAEEALQTLADALYNGNLIIEDADTDIFEKYHLEENYTTGTIDGLYEKTLIAVKEDRSSFTRYEIYAFNELGCDIKDITIATISLDDNRIDRIYANSGVEVEGLYIRRIDGNYWGNLGGNDPRYDRIIPICYNKETGEYYRLEPADVQYEKPAEFDSWVAEYEANH